MEQYANLLNSFDQIWIFSKKVIESYLDQALLHYSDNPWMKIVLAFVPAIIAIAYPLIVQTISGLDQKYKSTHIVEQFKKENSHKYFLLNLKVSVILALLCSVFSFLVFILAFLSVCSLLFLLFRYLKRLLDYQSAENLFKLLISRSNLEYLYVIKMNELAIINHKNYILKYWHPIIDLYKYSIRNKDLKLQSDIREKFIYPAFYFINEFEQKNVEYVIFPNEFYNSSYDIVSTYLNNDDPDYYLNIEVFVGSIFFPSIDKKQLRFFHENTLLTIWKNLILLIEHDRDDKIIRYWGNAHQFYQYELRIPYAEYTKDHTETNESIARRHTLEKFRYSFLQFHIVLGAYLMYKRKYILLKEVWFYTQSQPPDYVLMPFSMNQIFDFYFSFMGDYRQQSRFLIPYWFKNLDFDNMNGKNDVKSEVRKYTGLIFLRQWIPNNSYGVNSLALPSIPKNQSTKKMWLENLDYFKEIVSHHLNDKIILKDLGLDIISEDYCKSRKVDLPLIYLDNLKEKIENDFEIELKTSNLDKNKINDLDNFSINLIKSTYEDFQRISGSDIDKKYRDPTSNYMEAIRGNRMLLDKEAFIENSSTSYLFFDQVVANHINENYFNHISTKFHLNSKIKYQVANGQIFMAIDQLKLQSSKHVIVAFKVNFQYQMDYCNVEISSPTGREDFRYKSIPIFKYNRGIPAVYNTLFILNKEDLPMIKHSDWTHIVEIPPDTKNYWESMEKIDDKINLYRKIVDINNDPVTRSKYIDEGRPIEDLKNKLEVNIDFIGFCWFKKNVKMVEITESEKFQEGGIVNQLSDIRPFDE